MLRLVRTVDARVRSAVSTAGFALAVGLLAYLSLRSEAGEPARVMRIGLARSLFHDVPEPLARAASRPFQNLLEAEMGVRGELVVVDNAADLGRRLADGDVQVGVFQGYEFAWARLDHPEIQPLAIAVNQQRHLQAVVLVHRDGPARSLADLADRSLALPRGSRAHCRLFVERQCQALGKAPDRFFSHIVQPGNLEDALDDVVDGRVDAVVVDGVGLACYQRRKPGRFARLREVNQSEVFPATVIAYRPGVVPEALAQRFRAALLDAGQNPRGRQMLILWRLTGFEPVPGDYAETLANIARSYPPPGAISARAVTETPVAAPR